MRIWRQGLAVALAGLLAVAQPLPSLIGLRSLATALAVAAPAAVSLWSDTADARSSSRSSSGGYSRSGSSSSRTPSFSGSTGSSGGYARPSPVPSAPTRTPSLSSSDRDASRAASRQGLNDFQARQAPSTPSAPSGSVPNAGSSYSGGSSGSYTTGSGIRIPRQTPAYQQYVPPYYAGPSRFGMWDAAMLFFMLNSLNSPSHSAFFYHHAQDPNYLAWRAEADKMAATDPELKAKLAEVDRSIATQAQSGKPRDANYIPPDLAEKDSGGFPWGWVIVALVIGGAVYWFILRRRTPPNASAESDMGSTPFGLGKSILQGKLGNKTPYRPDYLRLGMGVTLDPSAFILLGPTSPVPRPAQSGGVATVTAISTLTAPGENPNTARQAWLQLSENSFVEVALAANGQPEGARYFGKIDEVYPADADEWAFWLAEEDGMIGWPEFQTKSGHTYSRQWLPGDRRIAPRRLTELRERADGVMERTISAMLYARDTGQKPPAPESEYLLVFASETPEEAWVELYLGIDLPLSSLGLA